MQASAVLHAAIKRYEQGVAGFPPGQLPSDVSHPLAGRCPSPNEISHEPTRAPFVEAAPIAQASARGRKGGDVDLIGRVSPRSALELNDGCFEIE